MAPDEATGPQGTTEIVPDESSEPRQSVLRRAEVREIFVIALGILLAFAVDASWAAWRERAEVARHLSAVDAELAQNAEALDRIEGQSRQVAEASAAFLAMAAPDAVAEEPDSVRRLIGVLWNPPGADISDGAMGALLASGLLAEIDDPELREALASWPGRRSQHRAVLDLADQRMQSVISPLLHRYVSEVELNRMGGFSFRSDLRDAYRELVAPSDFASDYDGLLRDRQLESLIGQRAALALIGSDVAGEASRQATEIRGMIERY